MRDVGAQLKDQAQQQFEAALKLDRSNSWAYYHLGLLFLEQRNYDLAIDNFKATIAGNLSPAWLEVWANIKMGNAYDAKGDRVRATAAYTRAERLGDCGRRRSDDHMSSALEFTREYQKKIPFVTHLKIITETLGEGQARLSLPIEPHLTNSLGTVHGGVITQGYGPENTDPSVRHLYRKGYHTGIDIWNSGNTPIYAALGGTVPDTWPEIWDWNRAILEAGFRGETRQHLRSILPLSEGRLFGIINGLVAAQILHNDTRETAHAPTA